MEVKEIKADTKLIAFCGLYCGACKSYLKGKCQGCEKNEKASWCKIRTCCLEHNYTTCADCKEFSDPNDCKKFNNFIGKIVSFLLKSDRKACITQIREKGLERHAELMAAKKCVSLKPNKK